MKSKFPDHLWTALEDPYWFCIGDRSYIFKQNFFDSYSILRDWFVIRRFPKPSNAAPLTRAQKIQLDPTNTTARKNAEEDTVEENFDLEELLSNRIDESENSYEHHDSIKNRTFDMGEIIDSLYLPLFSISSLMSRIEFCEAAANLPENDPNYRYNPYYVNTLKKRCDLLYDAMELESKRLVDWPDMKEIVKKLQDPKCTYDFVKSLKMAARWGLYFLVLKLAHKLTRTLVADVEMDLMKSNIEMKKINAWGDGLVLRDAAVVGVTTTGAAKYNELLKTMNSQICK